MMRITMKSLHHLISKVAKIMQFVNYHEIVLCVQRLQHAFKHDRLLVIPLCAVWHWSSPNLKSILGSALSDEDSVEVWNFRTWPVGKCIIIRPWCLLHQK